MCLDISLSVWLLSRYLDIGLTVGILHQVSRYWLEHLDIGLYILIIIVYFGYPDIGSGVFILVKVSRY